MRMSVLVVAAWVSAALAAAVPARADETCDCVPGACVRMQTGGATEISGKLIVAKGAYMLELDRATCFKGNGEADDIVAGEDRPRQKRVQLAPDEADLNALKALVGKRVVLTGDAFGAHTRYHLTGALFAPKRVAEAK